MDPYSQSYNFTDLLNSQLETQIPESFSPSMEVVEIAEVRRERRNWTPIEDIVLCSAWLNTSKNAVVGNEQKLNAFWKRIEAYFNASPKLSGFKNRKDDHCKQRWHKINDYVCKFVGCFEAAKRQQSSGQNENDVLKLAYEIFFQDHKKKFSLEHAWIELRNDQKWCASVSCNSEGNSNKRKFEVQSASSNTVTEQKKRHEGVKAAKGRGKGKVSTGSVSKGSVSNTETISLVEFEAMWILKQKDLAMKERLSKVSLLDNLITKKEPLDEMEIALKKRLIADMLDNV